MIWKENSLGFVIIQKGRKNGKFYTIKSNAMGGLKWMLKEVFFFELGEKKKKKNHSVQNQKQKLHVTEWTTHIVSREVQNKKF